MRTSDVKVFDKVSVVISCLFMAASNVRPGYGCIVAVGPSNLRTINVIFWSWFQQW